MEGDTHIFWRAGRRALLAGAALTLGGCVTLETFEPGAGAAIDPTSSAASAVAASVADPGPWPTFADIPELPADLRTAEAWRDAVAEQEADGLFTQRNAAEETWSLSGTEAFAADLRARVAAVDVQAPTQAEMAESEAYARALRARATPPPLPR
jgi:hypothetical protein